jgi:hypothetical protein
MNGICPAVPGVCVGQRGTEETDEPLYAALVVRRDHRRDRDFKATFRFAWGVGGDYGSFFASNGSHSNRATVTRDRATDALARTD